MDEICTEVRRLRALGVTGRLRAVHALTDKRCFVPCADGRCNCIARIQGCYCLVTEDKETSCHHQTADALAFINDRVGEVNEDADHG